MHIVKTKGTKPPGARSPRKINFLLWCLSFVGPQ